MEASDGQFDVVPVGVRARDYGWEHAGRDGFALRGIDLDIAPGSRLLLAGDSGSGKSTLLAALAGVLGGDDEGTQEGRLELISDAGECEPPGRSIPVGLVLQDPDSQVIASRVGDDVAFGCENMGFPRAEIWRRVRWALDVVGLDVPLDLSTTHLSGGQKQRLALAGVLAMGAGLILLDEPTANLDPVGAREVVAAVRSAVERTGATLIVVEHQYKHWEGFVPQAILLDHGEAVDAGDYAGIVKQRQVTGLPQARHLGPDPKLALCAQDLQPEYGPPRTLELPLGASTVLTGPNGAGKTTLLMTLGGLLPSRGGELELADVVRRGVRGTPDRWSSAQLAHRIAYVFQNPEHQFVARTVGEEMRVGPQVMGEEEPIARINELLERLRLEHLTDANPFTLSGGEKRRLSVATALVAAPSVLLLDEPTFGQDPRTFVELVGMLRELADSGVTIASITHDDLFSAALGDHTIELAPGEEGKHTHA